MPPQGRTRARLPPLALFVFPVRQESQPPGMEYMSRSQVPFHVQHLARPTHVERILGFASDDQVLAPASVRRSLTGDGYPITLDATRRSLDWAAKLGLFEKETFAQGTVRVAYQLTPRGRACQKLASYRREVYHDVMHFLLFATWELGGHQDWSWSYARMCEIFWRGRPHIERRKALFGRLAVDAAKTFPGLDPVIGTETVGAVSNWLRELSPPFFVLSGDGKLVASQEREWFSIELALAVSYLYAARDTVVQTPLLLDRSTRRSAPVRRNTAQTFS